MKRENQFLAKDIYMGVYMIDLLRETCKSVLKLDFFTAHGIMEFLSEFGLMVFCFKNSIQNDVHRAVQCGILYNCSGLKCLGSTEHGTVHVKQCTAQIQT